MRTYKKRMLVKKEVLMNLSEKTNIDSIYSKVNKFNKRR